MIGTCLGDPGARDAVPPPDEEDAMDHGTFDSLTRALTNPQSGHTTLRRLLRFLVVLPLSGAIGSFREPESEAAKRRHRPTPHHHPAHGDHLQELRKKK